MMSRAIVLRPRRQRGAAAVEFALVSLFLIPLLFGIVDFGFWFNDSISVRQGVRQGARLGVVGSFTACGTATTDFDKLKCQTKSEIGSVSGPVYVKIATPSGSWVKGDPLLVCAMAKVKGATGFTPLPHHRVIESRTRMSIEVSTVPSGTASADTLPADLGETWATWCS